MIEITMPTKRPELMVFEKSHLRAGHVVVRDAEKQWVAHSAVTLSAAVRWCRQNHYTWLDRTRPLARAVVQA